MAKGELVDERGRRMNSGSAYRVGGCLFYYRELESEQRIPFDEEVLYQDENILVADKPHFLPVVPSGRFLRETLLVRLKRKLKLDQLVPIHRLDRETAGVILFSLNAATRSNYSALFRNRKVMKVYEALAPNRLDVCFPLTRRSRIVSGEPFFRMKEIEGEPNSETYLDVMRNCGDVGPNLTRYQLQPITGRKHQLRVHLAALGFPIVNDRFYPDLNNAGGLDKEDDYTNPLKLLAKSISFHDPFTREEYCFVSRRDI
jgi:tRNA pseudouridine32 synthase/23S rRNA pseudouridine746 synthase